jgi:protein disulfide-isomerase A6
MKPNTGTDHFGGAPPKPSPPPPAKPMFDKDEIPSTPVHTPEPTLVFFHATWCPHCTSPQMQQVWREAQEQLRGKIRTMDIESKNPEISKHQVRGFPTIRFYPHGLVEPTNFVEFKGERTTQNLCKFAMTGGKF